MNGNHDLLKGLGSDDAARVLGLGTEIGLPSGAELFHLGDRAESIFLIERGRLRLTLPMRVRGREQDVLVEERTPGQTVGWSALVPPYRFTLTATSPIETEVIAISREALEKHLAECPNVGAVLSRNLAAIAGQRLQLFQAMWCREMERTLELLNA